MTVVVHGNFTKSIDSDDACSVGCSDQRFHLFKDLLEVSVICFGRTKTIPFLAKTLVSASVDVIDFACIAGNRPAVSVAAFDVVIRRSRISVL